MQPESIFMTCPGVAGDHRVHVLKWTSQKPNPALPSVICAHGLTRMGYDFFDIGKFLSATRDVYSITMPGRGESEWFSDPQHYNYPVYATDCIYIIRTVLGLASVDWLGTSMGGLIGMWTAALDASSGVPPLIRKLVLNDIGPFLPLSAVQRIAQYASRIQNFATFEDVERYCRAIYADFGIKTDKDWRFFAEHTVRPLESGGYTLHYDPNIAKNFGAVKEDVSIWPIYEAVKCPTLLLRGVRSDVLSKELAVEMTQRGPKAKLVTFENCGHAPALIDSEQMHVVSEFLS